MVHREQEFMVIRWGRALDNGGAARYGYVPFVMTEDIMGGNWG